MTRESRLSAATQPDPHRQILTPACPKGLNPKRNSTLTASYTFQFSTHVFRANVPIKSSVATAQFESRIIKCLNCQSSGINEKGNTSRNPITVRKPKSSLHSSASEFQCLCASYPRQQKPSAVAICVNSGWLFRPFILHTNATGRVCNVL